MTAPKALPSDVERAESVAGEHGALCVNPLSDPANERCTCPRQERIASVATLLRQVRAEASREANEAHAFCNEISIENVANPGPNARLLTLTERISAVDARRIASELRPTEAMLQAAEQANREKDAEISRLRAETARLTDGWRQEERDRRKHFEQGCINLKRAETAEAERDALREENARLKESLAECVEIVDKAGLSNLSNGVQLGAASWFVKASDRFDWARKLLKPAPEKAPAPDPVGELVEALESLYRDEWRVTVDWGSRDERQVILERCAAALAKHRKGEM